MRRGARRTVRAVVARDDEENVHRARFGHAQAVPAGFLGVVVDVAVGVAVGVTIGVAVRMTVRMTVCMPTSAVVRRRVGIRIRH
jgi:predicted phosphoribosyltransferase